MQLMGLNTVRCQQPTYRQAIAAAAAAEAQPLGQCKRSRASHPVKHDSRQGRRHDKTSSTIFGVLTCCHTLSQAGIAPCWHHTSLCTVRGLLCSTVQPTETQVPSISLTVPDRFLEQLRSLMMRAISITSSNDKLPLCLMFFSCRKGAMNP